MLYVVLVLLNKAEKSSKFNFRGDDITNQTPLIHLVFGRIFNARILHFLVVFFVRLSKKKQTKNTVQNGCNLAKFYTIFWRISCNWIYFIRRVISEVVKFWINRSFFLPLFSMILTPSWIILLLTNLLNKLTN